MAIGHLGNGEKWEKSLSLSTHSVGVSVVLMVLVLALGLISGGCTAGGSRGGITYRPAGGGQGAPGALQQSQPGSRTTGDVLGGTPPGGGMSPNGGGGLDYPPPGPEAGPLEQQSLLDSGQLSIGPWGPVIGQQQVVIGGQMYTVNRLSSPDPFTPTWQMPDGEILVSNTPLQVLMQPGYQPVEPPVVEWTEPVSGYTMHLYDGQILVYFKPTTTQLQIEQFIAQVGLTVVMSWFEPPDGQGTGNSIAWFQFEYPSQLFPTFGQAYAFFNANPLVDFARPNTTDEMQACYVDYYGNYVQWPTDLAARHDLYPPGYCKTVEAYYVDDDPSIRLGPEAGAAGCDFSTQVVAVVDDGVYRPHKDFVTGLSVNRPNDANYSYLNKISWCGVDCTAREYFVGTKLKARGQPEVYDPNRHGLTAHGTMLAGMISAGTRNPSVTSAPYGTGAASLAPTACILPVRMKVAGFSDTGQPLFDTATTITAMRAIRFEFGHTKWREAVRVINISVAGGKGSWWQKGDMKYNIGRDLVFNDRLYVAAAGQTYPPAHGQRKLMYPAAHDNVMSVTGAVAGEDATGVWHFEAAQDSNYWDLLVPKENSPYPVSGIYEFAEGSGAQTLPVPDGDGLPIDLATYHTCGGTSEATAQVSALAFLLYDKQARQTGNKLASSRQAIKFRIVHTEHADMTYQGDPHHVLAGVANYQLALNGW